MNSAPDPAILILVRHGEAAMDGHLTDRGRDQARALGLIAASPPLLTSPVERCRETLAPLARRLQVVPTVDRRLRSGSHAAAVAGALEELVVTGGVVCTHNDVIPLALEWLAEIRHVRGSFPPLGTPASRWTIAVADDEATVTWSPPP